MIAATSPLKSGTEVGWLVLEHKLQSNSLPARSWGALCHFSSCLALTMVLLTYVQLHLSIPFYWPCFSLAIIQATPCGQKCWDTSLNYWRAKGHLNALVYQDILGVMLPTLWSPFAEGYFLFQHDCVPVHKASFMTFGMN